MDNQLNIFDVMYPKYKITKPIRLIELFAGYGSQALALKYLGIPFEHWKICEWAVKSIQAYKDIHFTNDNTDYSKPFVLDTLKRFLYNKGISSNYNEPMTREQINRLNEQQLRTIYNNIVTTHNLVNIQQVKGEDLEILDTDKYDYIMTYSFPCQDLSLAGKRKGMNDTSTRSGMLWKVERILTECKKLNTLPSILIMENVPQVHSLDNMPDFHKWQVRLEELGYKSYWQDLIATDYGIPQTRNRCFMISILGDYSYMFPQSIPLKLKLKDLLENNVDEKYYLSDKQIESLESGAYKASKPSVKLEITDKGICQTLDTMSDGNRQPLIRVKNATKKGYLEATVGDGIDISSRMEHHRGTVQKGKTQTITTMGGENNGVVVKTKIREIANDMIVNNEIKENDVILTNYVTRRQKDNDFIQNNNITPTLTTSATEIGVCVETYQYAKSDNFMQGKDRFQLGKETSDTLQTTPKEGIVNSALRIRKLTPRECFRLMGVKDEDFEKVAKNQSDSSLYHLAGDSIVVNVLMAIFKKLMKDELNE